MMDKEQLPKILTLKSDELIQWCNNRKKQMKLSNAKLAALTNVPEGTIDRIFTGKTPEFRYSTIQPIIALLTGFNENLPIDEDSDFYVDTIDGYKLAIIEKNHIIDELKKSYIDLEEQTRILGKLCSDRKEIIYNLQEHIKWLEKHMDGIKEQVDELKKKNKKK